MASIQIPPIDLNDFSYRIKYAKINSDLRGFSSDKQKKIMRRLCREDVYYLLRYVFDLPFMDSPHFYQLCKFADDLEFNTAEGLNNVLILFFRECGKSLVFNTGKNIQRMLRDPNKTTLLLSNTGPGAKIFLGEIKQVLEKKKQLIQLFDDILYEDPTKSKETWSLDRGLTVKRTATVKEPTFMATGLVDGQPAKVHFDNLFYDDIVTEDSVGTSHMITKTTKAFELSVALGKNIKGMEGVNTAVGTVYDYADTYATMEENGVWRVFKMPWHNGDGETPRNHTKKKINQIRNTMSKYTFACQFEMNPTPDEDKRFYSKPVKYNDVNDNWDHILLVDPAGGDKEKREHKVDNTAMMVIGRDFMGNEYLVDGVYDDELKLFDRIDKVFEFVKKYSINNVWYEKVSMQSDIQALEHEKNKRGIYFNINKFSPAAYGKKEFRIESALMPRIANGKLRFPYRLMYRKKSGQMIDIIEVLDKEMDAFPKGKHDDGLDCLAQLLAVPAYGRKASAADDQRDKTFDEISDLEWEERQANKGGALTHSYL